MLLIYCNDVRLAILVIQVVYIESSEAELRTYVLTSNLELLFYSLVYWRKLLCQQQITLDQEKYVAFTILPCYINCIWSCLLEMILLSFVGEREPYVASRGTPNCLVLWKMAFMMDLGGDQVTICTLGLLSERRCLCLFRERNYGLSVSSNKVFYFLQKHKENI